MKHRIEMAVLALTFVGALAACGSTNSQSAAATAVTAPTTADLPTAVAATSAPVVAPTAASVEATNAPADAPTAASVDATSLPAEAPAATTTASSGATRIFTIVPEQSFASYEVQEQFLSRDLPNQAIGKTNAISGEFQFSLDGKPTGKVTNITVDLSKLTSDESRRDSRIRVQWLESEKYPNAVFTSTDVQGLPDNYTEGQEVTFQLIGDLTIRDVTKQVTFDVTGKLEGDTVTGTATTQIMMADFGIEAPSIAGMLTVKDGVKITVNFTAKES